MEKTVGQVPKRVALGRGMSSLLGDFETMEKDQSSSASSKLTLSQPADSEKISTLGFFVSPQDIAVNPRQPRKHFDDKKLLELSQSIKAEGILQPLIVTPLEEQVRASLAPGAQASAKYLLVAGERRLRAAMKAGLQQIPVVVKNLKSTDSAEKDREILRFALIENIQRADLTIIEEAKALETLIKEGQLTQEECADQVGKDRSTVANTLRLLLLPQEIQQDLLEDRMTMGHARALLPIEDKKLMLRARDVILKKQLNVRQTEQLVRTMRTQAKELSTLDGASQQTQQADLEYLAQSLRSFFRTKVRLAGNGQRGRIEISYFSSSELERLLVLMGQSL